MYYLTRLAVVAGLLMVAVALIVLGLIVVGALFIFAVKHGFLD